MGKDLVLVVILRPRLDVIFDEEEEDEYDAVTENLRPTSRGIRRGTRVAARTGPARFQFPGTRKFCLRNSE